MHTSIKLCCVAVVCSVAGVAQAQLLAQSAFDTNDDGWRSVSLGGSFVNPPDLSAPPSAPEYFPTGGNPGGHVCDEDVDTRYTYALAPAAFLGNKSGALGGTLTFDMAVMNGDPEPLGFIGVIFVGGGKTLYYDHGLVATTSFQTFTVNFSPSAAWRLNGSSGSDPIPTGDDILSVLQSLTAIYISQEWVPAFVETVCFDNVVMSGPITVPVETASWGRIKAIYR